MSSVRDNVPVPFVFIHVPKCAGSSMERTDWVGGRGHVMAESFRHKLGDRWEEYFSFGFARNPFDRVAASFFHFVKFPSKIEEPVLYQKAYGYCKSLYQSRQADGISGVVGAFQEFVTHFCRMGFPELNHFLPCSRFLSNKRGDLLVSKVFRFENLQEDWKIVCETLKQPVKPLIHKKVGMARPATARLYEGSREAVQVVRNLYEADFKNFNYAQDPQ